MKRTLVCLFAATSVFPVTFARATPLPPMVVHIKQYQFSPATIRVKFGQRIIWKNDEDPSALAPLKKDHNLITEADFVQGQTLPVGNTRRVCEKFGPGKSCSPSPTNLTRLFPPGWHTLTCTIGRDHALVMHFVIQVVG